MRKLIRMIFTILKVRNERKIESPTITLTRISKLEKALTVRINGSTEYHAWLIDT